MQTSPSMPEIASALFSTPPVLRASSRILCLILQIPRSYLNSDEGQNNSPPPADKRTHKAWSSFLLNQQSRKIRAASEAFLRFSPRVQFREPNLVFLDITSTAHFFKRDGVSAEQGLLESAVQLSRELGLEVKAAISDTAAGAQVFAHLNTHFICHVGEERENLQALSLPLLPYLEGLSPWEQPKIIEQIVTFFFMLGFEKIGDLERFTATALQDRWGATGTLLWKRLRGLDKVPISPLLPTEPLEEYVHFDFPVSLLSLLLHQAHRSIQFLFARLQGRCLLARKLILRLHCEYSGTRHKIEIEPNSPSRDLKLFLTLLENKLDGLDLENPIRDLEIEVVPCSEQTHQLDFFEPRTSDDDKLDSLFSVLQQSSIRTGVYEIHDSILPEKTWSLSTTRRNDARREFKKTMPSRSSTELCGYSAQDQNYDNNSSSVRASNKKSSSAGAAAANAYAALPAYGVAVAEAPRPTRLLRHSRRLAMQELQRLQILTGHPIERLEDSWGENGDKRDYYFAVSPQGQCLWIYQDLKTQEYYLHGYFD